MSRKLRNAGITALILLATISLTALAAFFLTMQANLSLSAKDIPQGTFSGWNAELDAGSGVIDSVVGNGNSVEVIASGLDDDSILDVMATFVNEDTVDLIITGIGECNAPLEIVTPSTTEEGRIFPPGDSGLVHLFFDMSGLTPAQVLDPFTCELVVDYAP